MDMAKKSKLSKLAMPKKRQEEDMLDLEQEQQDPMLEASEEAEGADLEGDAEAGEPAKHKAKLPGADKLAAASDDELMAEMKKRGLMSKLGEEEADEDYLA